MTEFQKLLNNLQYKNKFKLYDYEIEFIKIRAKELKIKISSSEFKELEARSFKVEKGNVENGR